MQVGAIRFAADIDELKLAFVPATFFRCFMPPRRNPANQGMGHESA